MSVFRADALDRWANVIVCILWLCSGQVREIFETFDADGSGEIDVDELFFAMRALNNPFQSKDDARAEMQKMDQDGSMTVNFLVFFLF
jgi:Ca2+-binding EF-hand superfamily protein